MARAAPVAAGNGAVFMSSWLKSAARGLAVAALLAGGSAALAAENEAPASFDVGRLPGIPPRGPNYTIANPVKSDGFLRIYLLQTPYGDFTVYGDAMVRMRIAELAAVYELDKVSNSEAFNKGLADAGLAPIKFAGEMIVNPVQTIGNTMAGIGNFFGQINSGMANAGKTQDDGMASLLGVTKKKRELAVQLGVDPYTDFQPLAVRLTKLSEAAATGGLVVNGALMAIPGVGGAVVGYTSTSGGLHDMARDYTAAQLLDFNRPKLLAMGADPALAEAFLLNRNFTPLDATAIVTALDTMPDVQGRALFIQRAASVTRRDAAYFTRRQAELLAAYQAKTGALAAFTVYGDFPFNQLRNGGVLGYWPLDAVSWTGNTSRSIRATTDALKRSGHRGPAEIRITGQATNLSKQQLKALGWTLVENAR